MDQFMEMLKQLLGGASRNFPPTVSPGQPVGGAGDMNSFGLPGEMSAMPMGRGNPMPREEIRGNPAPMPPQQMPQQRNPGMRPGISRPMQKPMNRKPMGSFGY